MYICDTQIYVVVVVVVVVKRIMVHLQARVWCLFLTHCIPGTSVINSFTILTTDFHCCIPCNQPNKQFSLARYCVKFPDVSRFSNQVI